MVSLQVCLLIALSSSTFILLSLITSFLSFTSLVLRGLQWGSPMSTRSTSAEDHRDWRLNLDTTTSNGSVWSEGEKPQFFLTMCRISFFYIAPVGLPPHLSPFSLLSLPQVGSVAAVFLQQLQVFDINLIIWHWSQRRCAFTEACCNMEALIVQNDYICFFRQHCPKVRVTHLPIYYTNIILVYYIYYCWPWLYVHILNLNTDIQYLIVKIFFYK